MSEEATEETTIEVTNEKLNLRMIIYPEKTLRQPAIGFNETDVLEKERYLIRQVAGAMIRNMYEYNGVGLAAQQVAFPGAMFVLDTEWVSTGVKKPKIFLNPVIKEYDGGTVSLSGKGEGCLSTPFGFRSPVPRSERVKVEWRDLNWKLHEEWFEGTEAIAVQHEIDHLHGYLFVDRISRLRQDMFKRRARKVRKSVKINQANALRQLKQAAKLERIRKPFTR